MTGDYSVPAWRLALRYAPPGDADHPAQRRLVSYDHSGMRANASDSTDNDPKSRVAESLPAYN
jgi:hypothetical protein